MKIALLGDLHIGIKDDNLWIQSYQLKFLSFMREELLSRGITNVIQAGDWFDVRRGLSQETLLLQRTEISPLIADFENDVLVGNHDLHHLELITPNSVTEVLEKFDHMNSIEKPTTKMYGDVAIDIIPWICKENANEISEFIRDSTSEYCIGHFELNGFWFSKGQQSSGIDGSFLKKYKQVWSGHFHTQSKSGNIQYIGTPYTLTMADADDKRGFHIFDTETKEMEFVQNPDCWHHKVYFNADTFDPDTISKYKNKAVKLVVEKRSSDTNDINFDVIEDQFAKTCYSLNTLDDLNLDGHVADDIRDIKDISDYVDVYVDSMKDENDEHKEMIKGFFSSLRLEAGE